jgi:subtilisin family serine protease
MRRITKKFAVTSIFILFLLTVFVPSNIIPIKGEEQFDLNDFMQQVLEEQEADSNTTETQLIKYVPEQEYNENYTYYIPSQVIVGFKPTIDVSTLETFEEHNVIDKIEILSIALLEVEEDYELELIEYLKTQSDDVYFAELNTALWAEQMWEPNDPLWDEQYGPKLIGCPTAWNIEKGDSDIFIAIIDSGVYFTHEDCAVKQINGWDFVGNDDDSTDDFGHGTQCAGVAAAHMNNEIGIAGVSEAGILGVRGLWGFGRLVGDTFTASKAIMYAAGFNQVWIMSFSFGVWLPSLLLRAACFYAYHIKNILLVAAAGNHYSSFPYWVKYPAHFQSVIAVAAVDSDKNVCDFSNYGLQIELAAPGKEIITTDYYSLYTTVDGTSYAAPHVAGVAHLYYSKQLHDDPTYQRNLAHKKLCREKLQKSAYNLLSEGPDIWTGYGLVQADEMLTKNIIYVEVVGNGTVSFSPNQALFACNSSVQLVANPSSGWVFNGWSGDLSSEESQESIIVDGDKYIIVTFIEQE